MAFEAYTTYFFKGLVPTLNPVQTALLDLFFTEEILSPQEKIAFDTEAVSRTIAPFVQPFQPGRGTLQPGYQTTEVKPAYLKPSSPINLNRPMKRLAGEQMLGQPALTPAERLDAIVVDDTTRLLNQCKRRWELMAVDAWDDGIVTCTDPFGNTFATVNFGRPNALTVTLTGGDRWGQTGISPLKTLNSYRSTFLRESKLPANRVIVDANALAFLQEDPLFEKQVDVTARGSRGSANRAPELSGEGLELVGYLNDSTEIHLYTGWYVDPADGVTKSIIPANTVYLGSTAPEAAQLRCFGAVQDAELGYPATQFAAKFTGLQGDPSNPTIVAHSAPLPALQRPEASMRIRVA